MIEITKIKDGLIKEKSFINEDLIEEIDRHLFTDLNHEGSKISFQSGRYIFVKERIEVLEKRINYNKGA